MILTGPAIAEAIASGAIAFTPFTERALNPNSIDIHLGDAITDLTGQTIDARDPVQGVPAPLPADGLWLKPGGLYTAESHEQFGAARHVPIVHGKSNIARAGLFVHVNGDMVDLGPAKPFVFQLVPVLPIRVYPRMAIAQVTFWRVTDEI